MTYAINPNAKNVWIRDNEDTMDLSPITDASSVYLENGRTIEQELGEGSMVSNVATVDTSMSKIIDDTLDGAYESCLLKGRTLVNVLGSCKFSLAKTEEGKSVTRYIPLNPLIKPNTKYLYVINVLKNTLTRSDNGSAMKYCETDSSKVSSSTCWGWMNHIYPGFTGVKKHIMTTKPVFEGVCELSDRIEIYGSTDVGGVIEFETFVIEYQEGMENWDIPYFEGLCDVKMPILRNIGKNLYEGKDYQQNVEANKSTGDLPLIMSHVKLKKNTDYSISYSYETNTTRNDTTYGLLTKTKVEKLNRHNALYSYHHDGYEGNGKKGNSKELTQARFNTGDFEYLYFGVNSPSAGQNGYIKYYNIQLEESSSPTPYESYKTNILRTSEEIVLRSLPNGVCDTLDLMTGEYVQRIGEVVLDGSEDEGYSELSVNENSYTVWTHFPIPAKAFGKTINNKCFINEWWEKESNSCGIDHNGSLIVTIKKELLSTTSTEALKTYLQQNPITVQYELATPIITKVDSTGVPFAYQNGHVILESGYEGQSLLPTLEYSTVVNKTGQIQSVTKTIVKQETQITELEKMLIQGIIEMDYNNTLLTLNLEIDEVI